MWDIPYEDRDQNRFQYKNMRRTDYDRLAAGAKSRYPNEFDYFKDRVEEILKTPMSRQELKSGYFEWEQGTTPEDFAGWMKRDRDDAEFDNMFSDDHEEEPAYEIDPNDDFIDPRDEDGTDYSMRQGEMGNPNKQR